MQSSSTMTEWVTTTGELLVDCCPTFTSCSLPSASMVPTAQGSEWQCVLACRLETEVDRSRLLAGEQIHPVKH